MSDQSARAKTLDQTGPRRTTHVRRAKRAVASLIAGVVLLGISGCGDDDPATGTEPTTAPTSSSTESTDPIPTDEPSPTAPATDEDKAAAALLGYLEVRDDAYATGRISKKLNKFATGREHFALQELVTQLTSPPEARIKGSWSHEIVAMKAQQDGAVLVTDCEDSSAVEIVRTDGTALPWFKFEDQEIPRRLEQDYMVAEDEGRWKVWSAESLPNKVKLC